VAVADWTGGKDDDLSFTFCEEYLFYALPVRWQSLTGQWEKGSNHRRRPSFAFCMKYLFYALPVRWQSLTGQWAKGSSLDEDLNFNFCEKYLCYAPYLWDGNCWLDNGQRAGFRNQGTNRPPPLSTSGSTAGSSVYPPEVGVPEMTSEEVGAPEMTSCLSAQWKEGKKKLFAKVP